ncbi:MAG: DMT family transporter [Pseudomonadota bacterium]|nr:DMT family transporter [Pseudomonadota bacterium]
MADTPAPNSAPETGIPLWLAFTLLILAAAAWGGSSVAGRAAAGNVPPMTLSFLRWTCALILFLPLGGKSLWTERAIHLRHWKIMIAFGFLGVVGFTIPYNVGLQYTPAINVTLLNGLVPILTIFFSFVLLRVLVTRGQTLGIVIALSGMVVIVVRGDVNLLISVSFNIGDLIAITAFISWSLYTVMLKWKPDGLSPYGFLVGITAWGCLMMLPPYLWELTNGLSFELSRNNLFIIGYSAVFPSFIAYICWSLAVPVIGANLAGITQYLNPVFGVGFAILILNETFETYHMVGVAAVFIGLYLSTAKRNSGG